MFERGRVVERDANGKAVRMLGVCMDLDEAKVAEREANARNERVEAALQLTTAGVWDWDVENGITHNTDGYYRVFGVDPAFGRANHMNWRTLLGTDPDLAIDNFRRRLQRVEADEQVLETEYRFRHTDGSWHWALDRAYVVERAPGRRHPPRARPGGRHHRAQDARDRAVGRRPALPRRVARAALRDLRHRLPRPA